MSGKKKLGVEAIRRRQGYYFVAHWIIGLVLFIGLPIISSVSYSFSNVSIGTGSVETSFTGLDHFKKILTQDPDYLDNVMGSIGQLLYTLPIILALSLVFAVLLNQKFKGRTIIRAIYFLPVILVTTNILSLMNSGAVRGAQIIVYSGAESTYGGSIMDFNAILANLDLPVKIREIFSTYLQNVFQLIYDSGVQIILFLSGLQSIPKSLYEVSKIEGATKWEEFWFVTVPMLRNVISLVLIYTMIEFFTKVTNPVIRQAYNLLKDRQVYDESSAMLTFYFVIGLAIMGTVIFLYNKFCMKRWE